MEKCAQCGAETSGAYGYTIDGKQTVLCGCCAMGVLFALAEALAKQFNVARGQ